MAIDVEIQDERGGTIARYDGPPLGLSFVKLAPPNSVCFRFIEPWGDATFNEAPIEELKIELREATSKTEHPVRYQELNALLEFLEQATGVHIYVKFIGD